MNRYNVFMDEVKPEDLSPAFLQDYLALPWSVWGTGAAQKYSDFIQDGEHIISRVLFLVENCQLSDQVLLKNL